jgi:hypothetical protein
MAVLGRRTDMDILVTDINLRGDKRAPRDFRFGPMSQIDPKRKFNGARRASAHISGILARRVCIAHLEGC